MLKKPLSLLLFLVFIFQAGYSADKLFPGYYIDLKGDTVRCNIEYRDWNLNPKTIRVQVKNDMVELGPEEIQAFGVDGYRDYVSAKVTYHLNPISGPVLPTKFSDSTVTKSIFLQVEVAGVYSLYVLVLPERIYLFERGPDRSTNELLYRAKMDNDSLQEDQSYRQQLVNLFMNEGLSEKYFERISNVSYSTAQIASLFQILNGTHTVAGSKKNSGGEFQIEVFAGAIMNSFPTSFDGKYIKSAQFDPSYSPSGGLNFLFSIPGHFRSFKFGLSLGYDAYGRTTSQSGSFHVVESAAYYYTTTYSETISLQRSLVLTNIYFMYVVNPLGKIKVFVKAGLNYNFAIGNSQDLVSNYTYSTQGITNGTKPFQDSASASISLYSIKSSYFAPVFSAGFVSGRSKLELNYWPSVGISDPAYVNGNTATSTVYQFGSVGLFYYFTLFSVK